MHIVERVGTGCSTVTLHSIPASTLPSRSSSAPSLPWLSLLLLLHIPRPCLPLQLMILSYSPKSSPHLPATHITYPYLCAPYLLATSYSCLILHLSATFLPSSPNSPHPCTQSPITTSSLSFDILTFHLILP